MHRFIYVRHALRLQNGVKLLHWLVLIFITTFSVHSIIILPFNFHFIKDTKYQDSLRGLFCSRSNITLYQENDPIRFSAKPKVHSSIATLLFAIILTYCYLSSWKLKNINGIQRLQQNILTLNYQFFYGITMLLLSYGESLLMYVIELQYHHLTPQAVFTICFTMWCIHNIGKVREY